MEIILSWFIYLANYTVYLCVYLYLDLFIHTNLINIFNACLRHHRAFCNLFFPNSVNGIVIHAVAQLKLPGPMLYVWCFLTAHPTHHHVLWIRTTQSATSFRFLPSPPPSSNFSQLSHSCWSTACGPFAFNFFVCF